MQRLWSTSPSSSAADVRRRDQRGTTLVEVVITISLLVVVTTAFLGAFQSVQRSETYARGRSTSLTEMRLVTARMTKEIRQGEIVRAPTDGGRLELSTYISGVSRSVTYQVVGTTLTRRLDGGDAVVILDGLATSSIFAYTPSAEFPELVKITLQVIPPNLPDTTVVHESQVRLRNIEAT